MHTRTGIVAGLATAIITVTAAPATADPLPIPLPVVSIDLLPDPTTAAVTTKPTPKPTKTKAKTKTTEPTMTRPATTGETRALNKTNGVSGGSAVRQKPTATSGPASSAEPALMPAAPEAPEVAEPRPDLAAHDRWFDLAALVTVAAVAAAFMARPRRALRAVPSTDPRSRRANAGPVLRRGALAPVEILANRRADRTPNRTAEQLIDEAYRRWYMRYR